MYEGDVLHPATAQRVKHGDGKLSADSAHEPVDFCPLAGDLRTEESARRKAGASRHEARGGDRHWM